MIRWTLFGVIGAALLAGVGYALWHSPPDPARHRVPFDQVELLLPAHVPKTFLAEVRALGRFPEVIDTGQLDLPARLGAAFTRHPWIEKVERVQVLAPGRVRAEVRFRTPAARIAHDGRTFFLDRHGVILPPIPDGSASHLMEIRGTRTVPAGLPGQRWGDPSVETAAEVAADLEPVRQRLQLVAIVIGPDPLQADLRLETRTRTQVLWRTLDGRADHAVDRKLKLLHDYLRETGPAGPYLLDVRSGVEVLRQPLRE